ncbi:twin-arginine translocase subunit TatC [Ilyomonas limi]|uniref:Sec-independent protein translocase protein TatC n=1 Tax=Ilyomonas limi TaxID=2575867 RepID=A0A4U3L7B7_9BACT|nr:twin-arginine translocase subunit TatC [Ilyomonas limi]TKK70950.1 twin-arginine translocase subunit TatC [Ilyomonas limi]
MANSLLNRGGHADSAEMSFIDHLEALRWHIIRSVIAIVIVAGVIFYYHEWVFDYIIAGPINPDFVSYTALCKFSHWLHTDALCLNGINIKMQTTTYGGQFLGSISMALVGGVIGAFPYIFWEFWRFVRPALKPKELRNTQFIIFWVSFFFFLGAAFGYFVLGPFTFNFLASFNIGGSGLLVTQPTLDDYLDNLTNIILGCGLAFELPVLASVLTRIGLITPMLLRSSRKYAIVVILIVSAVITPSPDWISQLIVFTPLFLLYQLSIIVSARVYKRDQEEEKKEWE